MDNEPVDLLDVPAFEGASRVIRNCLDRARAAAHRLEVGRDEEALHDFRVSVRRLRTTLRAYELHLGPAVTRKLRRRARDLAASTGPARDAEVQLAWLGRHVADVSAAERAGVWFLREELERREEAGYAALLGTASREQVNIDRRLRRRLTELDTAIRTAGGGYGPRFRTALRAALADRGGDLEGRLAAIRAASDDREAHAARIRAKRVRYLLEPVAAELDGAAGLIARLQQLQDLLGDLHDAHLLGAVIREISATATARGDPAALRPGLDLAARRLAEHRDDLFDGLRGSWLEGEAAPFFGDMKDLLDRLGDSGETDIELERKYLLSRLPPEAPEHPRREIEQGYLPGTRLRERVRRIREGGAERYVRCVKLGSGVRRIEVQEEAGRDVFEGLWPLTEGRRVAKIRYRVADGDLLWEIDRFTDRDLVLAEVELPSEDVRPELPGWLAPYVVREVTGEPEYLNVNLAR